MKNVKTHRTRYVICFNPAKAERDAREREEVIRKLREKLANSAVKGLVGNRAYTRYLH